MTGARFQSARGPRPAARRGPAPAARSGRLHLHNT